MKRRWRVIVAVMALVVLADVASDQSAHAATYSNSYLLRERLCLLQAYIERYANQHYSYYPARSVLRPGGTVTAPLWPVNPWTGRAMVNGSGIGDFTYTPADNLLSYRLTARYPGGTYILRGAVPSTRKMQADHRTREGLELVQQYIEMWARTHDDLYPSVGQVNETGEVGQQPGIVYWPHDPWLHEGMKQSGSWGNFTYRVSDSRDAYSLTAHYSRGGTFTVRGATSTSPWHRFRLALKDEILKRDLEIIDGGVRQWMAAHGTLPLLDDLTPAGAASSLLAVWPIDPYSGDPFTPGVGLGHFTLSATETGYRLTAPLAGPDALYALQNSASTSGRGEERE